MPGAKVILDAPATSVLGVNKQKRLLVNLDAPSGGFRGHHLPLCMPLAVEQNSRLITLTILVGFDAMEIETSENVVFASLYTDC